MQLANLSIARRLVLGFSVLLALMFIGSAMAIFQFRQIEDLQRQMVERDWVQSDTVNLVNVATRDNAVRTLELLSATDAAHQKQIHAHIARNKLAIDKALESLTSLDHSPQGHALLGQVKQMRARYVASFSRVADLVAQGRQAQASALMLSETLPAIAALQEPIAAFAELEKRDVAAHSAEIKRRIETSGHLMLALAGVGLLLGVVDARLIGQSITRPIAQALQVAQRVANGDLSGGVNVRGTDEMARLLRALQSMKDSLVASRMRAILDSNLDAVIQVDAQGIITGWNPQAQQCFGWSPDQALGRPVHDLIIPPRHRDAHLQGIARYLRSGQSSILNTRMEVDALHQGGHEFPIELTIAAIQTPSGTGFSAFVRDLTQRRRAEAESRIAAIAFESLEGMVVTDAQATILKVNDAFTRITGYSKDEVIEKKSSIFDTQGKRAANFRVPQAHLSMHRFWQGEVQDRRKNGEAYPAWMSVTAIVDAHDTVTHYIAAFVDMTEHRQFEERIHGLSFTDLLTGLPNRRALHDRLQQMLGAGVRRQGFGAILLLDLDNFKLLNDAGGREQGDLLLKQVVVRLKQHLHSDDLVARVDGDSFAVVLADLDALSQASASKARHVADRIRHAINEPFNTQDVEHRISLSIGICLFHCGDIEAELLIEHAEAAMYKAKQDGRNCTRFYDPATQAALEARFTLIAWLHKAVPTELRLYYQVQVDADGMPFGAETLIRWLHPEKGLISPAMFIPLAEESGLILPIGAWVLESACQQLARWSGEAATRDLKLAVNVSAKQFLQPDFADVVCTALERSGANPRRLKLELTESVMVNDADAVVEKMVRLKNVGVSFSLDDFGTGYSSLAYLKRLPLNQLKIDQSFVRNLLSDANDAAIVRAVINLGQSLGLEVIAEGVETAAQRDALMAYGCQHFQGYYFGRPLPVEGFKTLIRNHRPVLALNG